STYRVIVTNSVGTVTSNSATLTVNPAGTAPSITTQPSNQTVTAGATATFSVVASGSATLTYQWQKGTTNIGGATSASYTTPATVTGDSGSTYRVIVTNGFGTATSNNATLTVNAAVNPVTINVGVITFNAPAGSSTPVTRTITLTNASAGAVTVTPTTGGSLWLTTGGAVVVPAGGSISLTITANPAGLSGTVSATLTFTNSPGGQTRTIPVTLTIVATANAKGKKSSGCWLSNAPQQGAPVEPYWTLAALMLALAGLRMATKNPGRSRGL
ncbi:MAG TPA: hypothetical protein VL860_07945, partial [Planctomycetota bacterium]|nr:hypothetical protein [Planctomycetota bacterium]